MGTCSPREVCVIGAGMSGLVAARELRREGHAVTVMEQSGDVGGQWLYDPRTDGNDPLGAKAPLKVHSSMYASARMISPRECIGFSDFQFVPRPGGRDARRYPGHREVYCYLRDFCKAFGLADAIRLNTRVVRVAMAPRSGGGDYSAVKWEVRSVHVEPGPGSGGGGEAEEAVPVEEVFAAVVVANGHYSQPRLPSIQGMDVWRRRQLHSHSYREPDPFRDEVVVVVGCGESGLDIATELCGGVAKEVHLSARSVDAATTPPPVVSRMLSRHAGIQLHPNVDRLCEDGRVEFAGGCHVVADTVIYCTGYTYSFPFLDTGGVVTVRDNRVGPLYEHTFPPSLAPSLSFVGIPMRVFAPWFFEAQARWVALVLSGKVALPPEEDMLRAVQEDYRAREMAGVPTNLTHSIPDLDHRDCWEFVYRHSDLPRMEDWKAELFLTSLLSSQDDRDTFRDRQDDSESVREGVRRWRGQAGAQYEASLTAALPTVVSDAAHTDAAAMPGPIATQL